MHQSEGHSRFRVDGRRHYQSKAKARRIRLRRSRPKTSEPSISKVPNPTRTVEQARMQRQYHGARLFEKSRALSGARGVHAKRNLRQTQGKGKGRNQYDTAFLVG
jgi:hypothetical protein